MKKILLILIGFGGGVGVGTAAAAFITILQVVPRLAQLTITNKYIKVYYWSIILGFNIFNITYFSGLHLNINKNITIVLGLIYGVFIGLFSSALAEVLNVIPILANKFKVKTKLKYIIFTLMLGKVVGSLYYWIFI